MQKSKLLGHEIEHNGKEWVFSDTKESTVNTYESRACGYCGNHKTEEGHDSCIANLNGVANACCGHGNNELAYIQFENGTRLDDVNAILWAKGKKIEELTEQLAVAKSEIIRLKLVIQQAIDNFGYRTEKFDKLMSYAKQELEVRQLMDGLKDEK